jgi:hypothetical protein
LENLFVLDTKFTTLNIEAVEGGNDSIGISGVSEVSKS